MKSIMAIGAVLALPALAFGDASFTLTVGGSGTSGGTAITIDPGDSFTIDLGIIHDATGIPGFDCGLIASTANIFKATGRTVHLPDWDRNVYNAEPFDEYPELRTSAHAKQNYGGINSVKFGYWPGSPLDTQTITLATELTASGVYTISLGSPGMAGLNVLDQDAQFMTVGAAPLFEVTVGPERAYPPDSDGDGTPDYNDDCPTDPNKTEPGICGCGTPDTDSDNDGSADCQDGCPYDEDKTAPGACGCGVADTDSDDDGIADCNDDCPNDPDKTAPGECGCGTPDEDTDGDGTVDCNDPDTDSDGDGTVDFQDDCPNDPAKTAPGACGCGVADTDSDDDGIADCNDDCPNDPDKTAPGQCGCGTPDEDTDGDGTVDCNDPDTDSDGDGTVDYQDDYPNDPVKTVPGFRSCGTAEPASILLMAGALLFFRRRW